MIALKQSSAIRRAHLPDLLAKKSRSTVNCPILAWSFSTSSSWAASPSRPHMSVERVMRIGDIVNSRGEACRDQGGDALQSKPDQPIIDRRAIGRAGLTDMRLGALCAGGDIKQERLGAVARRAATRDLV